MADPRMQHSTSVSYIPVMASPVPRQASARGMLAGSLGLPQFTLIPSPRSSSGQASPNSTSMSIKPSISPSPAPSGGGSGIPKFRSLRNMLPFGPKTSSPTSSPPVAFATSTPAGIKHRRSISSIPTPSPLDTPKSGFLTFGPRSSFSLNREKRSPAPPSPSRSKSEDHGPSPVIMIEAPPSMTSAGSEEDPFRPHQSPPGQTLSRDTSYGELELSLPRSGDLSTIIESELSSMSMSKHIPPLDTSQDGLRPRAADDSLVSDAENDGDEDTGLVLAHLAKEVHTRSASILKAAHLDISPSSPDKRNARDLSGNLSASWEAGLAEFRRSMGLRAQDESGEHSAGTSSSASPVVVQTSPQTTPALSSSRTSPHGTPVEDLDEFERQVSFDLSSLDPDLATLLSPNNLSSRLGDDASALVAAAEAVTPPPPMSTSPSPSPEPIPGDRRTSTDTDDYPNSKRTSIESRRRRHAAVLGVQSSPPSRRSRPSSLTVSTSSHSTADPRKPSIDSPATAKRPAFSITPELKKTSPSAFRAADNGILKEARSSTSNRPQLGRSYSALAGPVSSGDPSKRRALTPRITPARPSTATGAPKARVSSDSRPVLRSNRRANEEQNDDHSTDVNSPMSRSVSALGISTSTRRVLGEGLDRPRSALSRGVQPRNRRRSMSVNEAARMPATRKATDWMGPRTARAFAAAGLLDSDRDGDRDSPVSAPVGRPASRMRSATPRIATDQDYRSAGMSASSTSLYVPSRAGHLDISRSASWGRRESVSRAMTMAELASTRGDSPVTTITSSTPTSASNPKTFSSSTATSLSGGSPQQQFQQYQLESALLSMKEKHSIEMEALLSALADSQRSSRSLREENSQLRGRIHDLEEQITDLIEQLGGVRRSPPLAQTAPNFARSILGHSRPGSRASSTEAVTRRHSKLQSFVLPSNSSMNGSDSASDAQITMREPTLRMNSSLVAQLSEHNARKRSSTTSSIFPVLPSNMSMLLHDDGDVDNTSPYSNYQAHSHYPSQPPSPTLFLSHIAASASESRISHAAKPSVSSIGSGSSTNANMSILSMPGSPTSLHLRPEHEKHLVDMMSLDLSIADESDS